MRRSRDASKHTSQPPGPQVGSLVESPFSKNIIVRKWQASLGGKVSILSRSKGHVPTRDARPGHPGDARHKIQVRARRATLDGHFGQWSGRDAQRSTYTLTVNPQDFASRPPAKLFCQISTGISRKITSFPRGQHPPDPHFHLERQPVCYVLFDGSKN